MRILVDTRCWLWMQTVPSRLTAESIALVEDPDNELFLSAASSWEIALKHHLGRITLPVPPWEYVPDRLRTSGVRGLAVEHAHALHVATLPPHHSDLFDRLIIAQAQLLGLPILTDDRRFEPYDVRLIWAT